MTAALARRITVLMTGIFLFSVLFNLGAMNAVRFMHEVAHEQGIDHGEHDAAGNNHHKVADRTDENEPTHSLSSSEHQLLHGIDQLPFFVGEMDPSLQTPSLARVLPKPLSIQSIPLSTIDLPFRPPRSDLAPI